MSWMEPRKIIKVGEKSYAITLPKKWAKILGLKPRDSVNLVLDKTGVIHVYVINKKPKETVSNITIDASKLNLQQIEELLRACYIEGLDTIIIKNFNREEIKVPQLNQMLYKLPGVLLLEPGLEDIVIKIAITEDVIDIEEVITRISHVLELMFDYMENYIEKGNKEDAESLLKLDDELDRLYHLGQRLIRKRVRTRILSAKEYLDILDFLTIINSLEHIGDCLDRSIRILLKNNWSDIKNKLKEALLIERKIVFDTIGGIRHPDTKIIEKVKLRRRELKKILKDIVLQRPELSGVVDEFDLISTLTMDMAEISTYRWLRKISS